ncbi:MAG: hypothetical protein Q4F67_11370 [Propionibacteriaceae bacterium]|nr:hypothetical protein [Propionibacteriaceae bacterium]
MRATRLDVYELLNNQGGVISHECPWELNSLLRRMAAAGELTSILPGIFAASSRADDLAIRMRAAKLRDPDVVFTGLTAAHLLWGVVHRGPVCATGRTWSDRPGFRFTEASVDPDWVTDTGEFRCMSAPLAAVDLIPERGGEFVDHLLRVSKDRGSQVLQRMWDAVAAHPNRPGNAQRRRVLRDSRDRPWSAAERTVHSQLRAAGIKGWRANYCIETSAGRVYFLDVVLPADRLVLEVDGYEYHSSRGGLRTGSGAAERLGRRWLAGPADHVGDDPGRTVG